MSNAGWKSNNILSLYHATFSVIIRICFQTRSLKVKAKQGVHNYETIDSNSYGKLAEIESFRSMHARKKFKVHEFTRQT